PTNVFLLLFHRKFSVDGPSGRYPYAEACFRCNPQGVALEVDGLDVVIYQCGRRRYAPDFFTILFVDDDLALSVFLSNERAPDLSVEGAQAFIGAHVADLSLRRHVVDEAARQTAVRIEIPFPAHAVIQAQAEIRGNPQNPVI